MVRLLRYLTGGVLTVGAGFERSKPGRLAYRKQGVPSLFLGDIPWGQVKIDLSAATPISIFSTGN
jgi:hypothetical protein